MYFVQWTPSIVCFPGRIQRSIFLELYIFSVYSVIIYTRLIPTYGHADPPTPLKSAPSQKVIMNGAECSE